MENFKTTILLNRLNETSFLTHNGQDGIFIPFEPNSIFLSEARNAYLDLLHWSNRMGPDQRGNTHMVKLGTSQDFATKYPQYSGKNAPALGNSKPLVTRQQQAQMPYQQQAPGWPTYPPQQSGGSFPPPSK